MQVLVAQKVTAGVYKGVTTTELDELAAETAAGMTSQHPDYAVVRSQPDSLPPRLAAARQSAALATPRPLRALVRYVRSGLSKPPAAQRAPTCPRRLSVCRQL